jgi:ArsR family transcriptional regulator
MSTKELYEYRAQIIKAMAHPSRLLIIDALFNGEKCVCELQKIVAADISTVSKHLSILKSSGIVECRKEGLQVFYRLRTPCILNFLACIDEVIVEDVEKRRIAEKAVTNREGLGTTSL